MTSQKSLKNNIKTKDFKRSFIGSLLFPAIAFLVLFIFITIPVIQYVLSEEFLTSKVHNEVSMFLAPGSTFTYMFQLLPIGMILCGMLTAIKSFYYLLSKKQVNVYLSLSVKRNTMFVNRLVSGVIALFVAVIVPMAIIYIVNIVNFGISAHLTKLFLYITSLLFVCGLTGFAIASAMIMVSGNIFEVALSAFSVTMIPLFAFRTVYSLIWAYLNGYIRTSDNALWMQVFSPWTMAINLQDEYCDVYMGDIYDYSNQVTPESILKLLTRDTTPDKFKIPEYLNVDWGFVLPVIIWFVVSLALIGVAYYLFNKRKAEHANSLGKFPISRAVICTCLFTGITWIGSEWFGGKYNLYVLFVLLVVVTLVAYFLVQLILTRKSKTAFNSFKWYGVLVGALAVCSILINTGFLGTYNKIPDKADVKSVTIEAKELDMYSHYIYPWEPGENFVESSTDESKQIVLDAYELLKNEKIKYDDSDYLTSVTLGIRDNDGKIKFRDFNIYSEDTYMKYIQLIYGSEYFDEILKNYLVEDAPEGVLNDSTGYLKGFNWAYSDNDMLIKPDNGLEYISDVNGLCEALYKDLSAMSVDKLIKNSNRPIGVLVRTSVDVDYPGVVPTYKEYLHEPMSDESGVVYEYDSKYEEPTYEHALLTATIPIYADMTNTLNFLKENGYELTEEPMKIKEVLYTDSPLSINYATVKFAEANKDDYKGWGEYYHYFSEYTNPFYSISRYSCYHNDMIGYFLSEPVTEYDLLKRIYKDAGHPLISVTDTEKAEKIVDKTVSNYLLLGDTGRYVYVVYEEGPIVCYYLPEANVNVVK